MCVYFFTPDQYTNLTITALAYSAQIAQVILPFSFFATLLRAAYLIFFRAQTLQHGINTVEVAASTAINQQRIEGEKRIMLKKTFFKLTGGRPMTCIEYYFHDNKTQRPVYRFQDGLGRYWMAHTKWATHRIESVNKTFPG